MDYLPLFYKLTGKQCLVVGGGEIATRKASMLQRAGAHVRVVAPRISPSMDAVLDDDPKTERYLRSYQQSDLDNMVLVIAATDDSGLNQQVSEQARAANIPVNVVDNPELCTFILPSIIDRSPIVIGVSSGGQSPVLARMIRAKLESTIPASYGRLAHFVGRFRDKAKARFSDVNQRRDFWEQVLDGPIAEFVFAGKEKDAEALLEQQFNSDLNLHPCGEVYLVGAGPGDPDLLTFRALRLMQQADVVLFDRLVSPEILDLVRRDAERIYVGKARSEHAVPQDQINEYLVKLAKDGRRVCRLKGGDPFIFGRGGEEIDRLFQEGIHFQVVPGITAASGCASYAGIPLTHRDHAQSVRFITGHLQDGSLNLDWETLAKERQTLVFYMGLLGLPVICAKLVEHGLSPETPIALVQQGTTRHQKVWTSTLENMAKDIEDQEVKPPTLIIVGSVVKLRERLSWFDPSTVD
ncbi:uroporphyrinogen-III C-methyltransferase [Ketobacter sp. MCCC 1A13808]|uniref:siroheme synthase CysG n=1 Tax=Ketobacter sp. MCCC 1A13808 TaxID=2602738 RepID=UPI0013262C82|nr:siroheme synthase CysG [Ketobacter sp. MCCC 1A13808]MVF10580.1 uroporphyrinogen-III C-methyltransferase [Ketobacter sp. MCCC 1A13808]